MRIFAIEKNRTNMGKVLVIGAGGVATVAAHKLAQNAAVFTEIMIASRTKAKCDAIAAELAKRYGVQVATAQVDADNVPELTALLRQFQPDLVMNLALPYQDLHIMDACLAAGCNYLDTANYEPLDEAKYQYSWQWAYHDRFREAGLTVILGCGFDRAAPASIRHTLPNTISTRFTNSILSIVTLATTTRRLLPISIPKSTFAR